MTAAILFSIALVFLALILFRFRYYFRFKTILSTIAALVASYGIAIAISGNQIGFPIVGPGPSYCASFGNNGVCNFTVPAGPTVTGNETFVANTNAANGANPQTVLFNLASLGALPYQYVAGPLTANTTTLSALTGTLILDPTQTIAAYAVNFAPVATLTDGQILRIAATHTITTLTLSAGTGAQLSNTPTTIGQTACTAGTTQCGFEYVWVAPVTTWFRLQ